MRPSRTVSRCLLISATCCALMQALPARAQQTPAPGGGGAAQPSENEIALARQLFREGVAAAGEGQWERARIAFQRAYELYAHPITLLNLAGAQAQTGRLVQGTESYRRFLREATTGAPAAHRADAERALREIDTRVPKMRLEIDGLDQETDVILLDEREVSFAALEAELPVDPGAHVLVIRRGEEEVNRETFSIAERQVREVRVTITAPRIEPIPDAEELDEEEVAVERMRNEELRRQLAQSEEARRRARDDSTIFESPWFWTIAGVVLVGGGVTAGILLQPDDPEPFRGNLNPGTIVIR